MLLDGRPASSIMVRVFLVDDHEVFRRGLVDLLSANDELEVIGEAGSVAEALVRIQDLQPDVAVLDVRLTDGDGIDTSVGGTDVRAR